MPHMTYTDHNALLADSAALYEHFVRISRLGSAAAAWAETGRDDDQLPEFFAPAPPPLVLTLNAPERTI